MTIGKLYTEFQNKITKFQLEDMEKELDHKYDDQILQMEIDAAIVSSIIFIYNFLEYFIK